jgi:hypothetical protein
MKSILIIIVFCLLSCKNDDVVISNDTIESEYCLEIIDQNKVKVHSHSTDIIYIITFDKVEDVLMLDNE